MFRSTGTAPGAVGDRHSQGGDRPRRFAVWGQTPWFAVRGQTSMKWGQTLVVPMSRRVGTDPDGSQCGD